LEATPETIAVWEQRISQREQSGLSIAAWCTENKINKGRFHYWNQKLNKIQRGGSNGTEFADVSSIISNTAHLNKTPEISKIDNFQVFLNNITITVPSNFSKDTFKNIMEVIVKL